MSKKYIFAQTIFTHFLGQYLVTLRALDFVINLLFMAKMA